MSHNKSSERSIPNVCMADKMDVNIKLMEACLMFKKSISLILTVVLVLLLIPSTATASESSIKTKLDLSKIDSEVVELAYMDTKSATNTMKVKILEARKEIIFSHSWAVDEQCRLLRPDGSTEALPKFSELFPGWDVPKTNDELSSSPYLKESMSSTKAPAIFDGSVYLSNPSPVYNTTPFKYFTGVNRIVVARATKLPASTKTYNIGAERYGTTIIHALSIPVGYGISFPTSGGITYNVRASTYSTPGIATMYIN